MGLELRNPLIVGSSGLTNSVEHLKEIAQNGAGAVVLKSIFEEQIKLETEKLLKSDNQQVATWKTAFDNIVGENDFMYEEALSYIGNFAKEHTLTDYLNFVSEAKKAIDIPLIASIHCVSQYDWQYFAKRIQNAGADAIELNVYLLPSDFRHSPEQNEKVYYDIVNEVKKHITIPFALKIGYYFSSLAQSVVKLSESGVSGLVLFNRPYNPDIDIHKMELTATHIYSSADEYARTLRWIAILSGRSQCDLAASGGIHDYESIVKQLLAGAKAVQMASFFYKNGFQKIGGILKDIENWMTQHNFNTIEDFRGKLSQTNIANPAAYERVQFMKLYSKIE